MVFPCVRNGSCRLTAHGFQDATTDVTRINEWWTVHPSANVAISTQGLLVLDIDAGSTWLENGSNNFQALTVPPLSLTANGGQHFIFRQPVGRSWRNTTGRIARHVDTRADGGYIVVPPSVLTGDKAYRWAEGQSLDEPSHGLPEPPVWLAEQLDSFVAASTLATGDAARVRPARRNPWKQDPDGPAECHASAHCRRNAACGHVVSRDTGGTRASQRRPLFAAHRCPGG